MTDVKGGPPALDGPPVDSTPAGPKSRHARLLIASIGVSVAALAIALVLVSPSSGGGPPGGGAAGPGLAGISQSTAALLSLSTYPQQHHQAPDFSLTDQNGQPVSLSQFRGRSVVLSFNDDQCTDVCTLLAEDIVRADADMGPAEAQRVVFLSVNVNPFSPGVADVRQWTRDNDLAHVPNWFFATGSVPALQAVWKAYGVYVGADAATRSVTHSTYIEFVAPDGTMRATADFGQNAVDVDPYAHGLAQVAVDLLPPSGRTAVAGPATGAPVRTGSGLGQEAPPIDLPVVSAPGTSLDVAGWRGEPTVVNFWASTCQGCRAELAAFAQVASADPKVHFVGIDVADPSPSAAQSMALSAGITYPILADRAGRVSAAYGISGLPTTVYIDPQGRVAVVHPGAMTAQQLRYTLAQFFPSDTPAGG